MNLQSLSNTAKAWLGIGAFLVVFAGSVFTWGNQAAAIWNTPERIQELKNSNDGLVEDIKSLKEAIEGLRSSLETSGATLQKLAQDKEERANTVCMRFEKEGNTMEDTPIDGLGKITLKIVMLSTDCDFVPPPRIIILDSGGVYHDGTPKFNGKELGLGQHTLKYGIYLGSDPAPGIARIFAEMDYIKPDGQRTTITSEGVFFNILPKE